MCFLQSLEKKNYRRQNVFFFFFFSPLFAWDKLVLTYFKMDCCTCIWAASWQNQQNGICAQRRLRSAWASTQSDRSTLCAQWLAKDPSFLHADSEDSDQTRLIRVFAGRTCHFVGFVTRRLISCLKVLMTTQIQSVHSHVVLLHVISYLTQAHMKWKPSEITLNSFHYSSIV